MSPGECCLEREGGSLNKGAAIKGADWIKQSGTA